MHSFRYGVKQLVDYHGTLENDQTFWVGYFGFPFSGALCIKVFFFIKVEQHCFIYKTTYIFQ